MDKGIDEEIFDSKADSSNKRKLVLMSEKDLIAHLQNR